MTRDEIWLEAVAKSKTETMPEHYAGYKAGYFDAALSRETEIATLRARVMELTEQRNAFMDSAVPSLRGRVSELETALREMLRTFECVRFAAIPQTGADSERAWRSAFDLVPPIPAPETKPRGKSAPQTLGSSPRRRPT